MRRLWRALLSLKIEKGLKEKFERLNQLQVGPIREPGVVKLKVQLTTRNLVSAGDVTVIEQSDRTKFSHGI